VSSFGRRAEVDDLHAPRYVNYPVGATRFRNTNLFDTLADAGHWLEIVRLVPSLNLIELNLIELITSIIPRVVGEVSQAFQRIANETTGRLAQFTIYIQMDIEKGCPLGLCASTFYLLTPAPFTSPAKTESPQNPQTAPHPPQISTASTTPAPVP
jgi:hypothetical protein